jgi:hypothetical protein
MPSEYLAQSELVAYGVPNATAPQIQAASSLIDAYLQRTAGLQWMPDLQGLPCYMAGLTSGLAIPLPQTIGPGQNINVTLPGPASGNGIVSQIGMIGSVVILDRASTNKGGTNNVEACVVSAMFNNTITLGNVIGTHQAGTLMEFGLVTAEQRTLPSTRTIARLGNWPIRRILSGLGSYRYGRRNDQQAGLYDDRNLISIMQTFGGPPAWQPFVVNQGDFNEITGEVWIPTGIYMSYYSDVRLYYVSGYPQLGIPFPVKQACAAIIQGNINTADMVGGVKMAKAGDTALQRFTNSVLDEDTRAQLNQYKPRLYV